MIPPGTTTSTFPFFWVQNNNGFSNFDEPLTNAYRMGIERPVSLCKKEEEELGSYAFAKV